MRLFQFECSFPLLLLNDLRYVCELIPFKTYVNIPHVMSEDVISFYIDGQPFSFPYRIYYMDIPDDVVTNLSTNQQMLLHCIYSRSCNGFVREKHIKALLQMDFSFWAIPFIVKVCDEYVVEILDTVYGLLKEKDTKEIMEYCKANQKLFCKSYNRMISYWNEFYRYRWYNYRDYVGRKLFIECFGASRSMKC